jgi:GNAT superfamily N-acetyltransferase
VTDNCVPEAMLVAHARENNPLPDTLELNPDWAFYRAEYRAGRLIFVTARAGRELIGYMTMTLRRHPHYSQVRIAIDDLHWLHPSYRGRGSGKAMIAFAEAAARQAGASIFSMRCKADSPHGWLFEQLGYRLTDHVYIKDLSHADSAP